MRGDKRVRFHRLTFHRRLDDWMVGSEDEDAFILVDDEGKAVIKALEKHTIAVVEEQFPDYDVQDIISQLSEAGLVHGIGSKLHSPHRHVKHLARKKERSPSVFNLPIFHGTIIGIIAVGIALLISSQSLGPHPSWFFASSWLGMLLPLAFIVFWALQFTHELGHYLAMRAKGLDTGFRIVNKWHLLLPQADIKQAEMLEAKDTIPIYLGGIFSDLFILSVSVLLIVSGVWVAFFKLVVLIIVLELLLQMTPLPMTDISKVIQRVGGIKSLSKTLAKAARNHCVFCKKRVVLTPAEKKVASAWLPLVALASVTIGIALGVFVIPIAYTLLYQSFISLVIAAGTKATSLFVDSLLSLLFISVFVSMYIVAMLRQHHFANRTWFTWLASLGFLLTNSAIVFLFTTAAIVYANPAITAAILFFLGIVYGALFLKLLDYIRIEEFGFAHDTILPAFAALTALLLTFAAAAIVGISGQEGPIAIYGISYAAGMIGALVL